MSKAQPKPARAYHHGNLRAAVVAAALDALAEKAPSEISLRELARTVGVGHSSLYVHFRDRDELLAAIAGEGFGALLKRLEEGASSTGQARLADLARAYLAFARKHPAHYRTMFRPENILSDNIWHVEGPSDACFQLVVRAIEDLGGVATDVAVERAVGIWSMLHGLVLLGDNSGPLHQKVPAHREEGLAVTYVGLLTRDLGASSF